MPDKPTWSRAVALLSGFVTDMDRDFVLLIAPQQIHVPRLYIEVTLGVNQSLMFSFYHINRHSIAYLYLFQKVQGSTALMGHLIPDFVLQDQKVELIFLLDRSGSMCGQSIGLAKQALAVSSFHINC
jgi:hypothetical protein